LHQTLGRQAFLHDQPAGHPLLNNTNIVPEGAQNWAQFIDPLLGISIAILGNGQPRENSSPEERQELARKGQPEKQKSPSNHNARTKRKFGRC
jgi:hypothetical protein